VSYDLAVWEGQRPADDEAAGGMFEELYACYVESGVREIPTERIRAYAEALHARYPDIDEDERSPWSTAPLIGEAIGPFFYFPMVYSRCEEASAWAAQLAADHGLVCFDPQMGRLRPVPARIRPLSLRTIGGPKVKFRAPPEPEAIAGHVRAALQRGSYAILDSGPEQYVQAGSGKGTGMGARPGYAVEYRDGSPDAHFRFETLDLDVVVAIFDAYAREDPSFKTEHPWRRYG
jgi:hypothetical protein